jgi:ESS family glutamate:Na+ symporter
MAVLWKLNPAQVLGIAAMGVALGSWLKRKVPALDRWDIPVPVAGGMIFSLAALALRDRVVNLEADTLLRDLLMIAFMTTIGLSARLQLIARGGAQVIYLLILSSLGALLQNGLGIALARLFGLDPRLGILAGSVALAGGPATAVAFGGTFESRGVHGAAAVAMASATFGIAVAGLIAGHIGGWLIRRRGLRPAAASRNAAALPAESLPSAFDASTLLPTVLVLAAAMGIGNLFSQQIERHGIILPAYIGAMIAAALIRNLNDRFGWIAISQPTVDALGRVALYLFITMALLTLRLWELEHLALPLVVILAAQVALCWLLCVTLPFRIPFRRDYENAITSAGFCGYMLGITANAMASMEELVEKYGPAPESFLVVPVVGAFLIDFTNSLIITGLANWLR